MIINRPGFLTTIQDLGRVGFQKYGVPVCGAMDPFAFRTANILVGNAKSEAALEVTLQGPTIQFTEDAVIAICGASLSPMLDGEPIQEWRPLFVRLGSTLAFGQPVAGCRAYIAVHGGFEVLQVMGSKSTYVRGGFGGLNGRALKRGDVLNPRTAGLPLHRGIWNGFVSQAIIPSYSHHPSIRVVKGPDFDSLTSASKQKFLSQSFLVTQQSDRMGYRLNGSRLQLEVWQEKISSAVTLGTIQLPADGNLIVLMADRQTMGGYPCIAQVIGADIPLLAQLRPFDNLKFQMVTIEEAQRLWRNQERNLQILRQAVHFKEVDSSVQG